MVASVTKSRVLGILLLIAIVVIFLPLLWQKERDPFHRLIRASAIPAEPNTNSPVKIIESNENATLENLSHYEQAQRAYSQEARLHRFANKLHALKENSNLSAPEAWVLQLGSFAKEVNANKLKQQLEAKGFTVYLRRLSTADGLRFRIYVGPELQKDKVQALQQRIEQELKLKSIIVKYQVLDARS